MKRARGIAAGNRKLKSAVGQSLYVTVEHLEGRRMLSVVKPRITALPPDPVSSAYQALWHSSVAQFTGPLQSGLTGGPEAPGLTTTIDGITFDENGANNGGTLFIPASPSGAAGPTHVVSVVNSSIEWHTKAGVQENSQSLASFFAPLTPDANRVFSARAAYDTQSGRFLVVASDVTDTTQGGASNTSRIFVAVSDDTDPNGTWRMHSIDTKLSIGGVDRWSDFPAVGFDGQAVYVTANMFSFGAAPLFGGSRLWIINKTPFYTDPGPNAAAVTLHDPSTAAGLPSQASTLMPAKMYGATLPANMGMLLVNTGFLSGPNELVGVIRITNPLAVSPTFSNTFVNVGDVSSGATIADAPQSGSATLVDAGTIRAADAVWRNNQLYLVNTVNPGSGVDMGQATARWYRLNADGVAAPTIGEQGPISGEDIAAGTRTFFPSIAVDNAGNVGIGFAASGPNIFPGAYYTVHGITDAAGSVQSSSPLAAGLAFYVRSFGLSGGNRWGDYSSMSVDPSDDSFWAFNAYADTQGTPTNPGPESGRWATRFGNFPAVPTGIPTPGTPDLAASSDAGVSNTDNITNLNILVFTGTGVDGLTVQILANGTLVGSALVSGGMYSVTTSQLADNVYTMTAVQTDGATFSPPSAGLGVTIDTVAPTLINGTPIFNYDQAAHSLTYTFSENVGPSLAAGDVLTLQTPGTPVANTFAGYDGPTNTATFTFPTFPNSRLPNGDYQAIALSSGITDIAGNALAGNPLFPFFFLNGDANRDRIVSSDDFNALASNFGQSPRTFAQGDFSYDTIVNSDDFNILASNFGISVGSPAAARFPGAGKAAGPFSAVRIGSTGDDDTLASVLA